MQLTRTGDTTFESYVNLQAVDDNASLESDYTFNNLIYFAPGENNKSVEIELFNDLEIEATENFDLEITSGFGEDNYVVGTQYKTTVDIEDNSPTVEFGAASYTVNEGEGNTIVVQLTRTGDTTFESYVNLQAVDDNASLESDYTFNNLIYFAPGENNKSVEIELFNDREIEATENFDLEITSGFGEDNYVVGTQYKTTVEIEDNDAIIAEVGQITDLNNESQTILLNHNFVNPVIFAQPLSRNGGDSSTIRITDIQSNSFSVQLQETTLKNGNPHDGFHTTETFSFLVVEQGIWELSDGSILEAGNVATDAITTSTGESVDFNNTFANTPVVLTQVQTNNDTTFVRTRQRNGDANGFDFALEEEELYKASGHGTENVAWLAISLGEGNWDGNHFIAGNTGDQVTHNWHTIDFANNFTNAPKFLGNIATFDGPDSSGLRYRNLTNGNVQIMIEEDTSQDNEQNHTTEDINFLALEADGNLTGSVDSLTGLADSQAGTVNADIFVLGDASESFYDNYGQQDYAEISDFDLAQDIIQLHGLADDCYLGSSPTGIDDQGIFLKVAGMEDELVGVVKNTNTLDINSSNFAFV
ncbi:Na-Ca exchanger/integrin-beta4 [Crocosphaera watsonii WH 8501]|uniref:Na-Ca exchanger/integrin-beta4 n=1 Tax=Crocosphaera watsonii WH 8501 TaxID=165597 RepID=Q4BYZ6_CROWT|nr:Na-Ca exchanger/integrin-beta4 [Crocosphaera watsonii WH 8501]